MPSAFLSVAPAVPHIQAGTLRALAVSGAQRLSIMPDVPTVAESGYPGFSMDAWWSITGPAGLPAAIVQRVATAARPILDDPAFAARFASMGVVPAKEGPEELARLIRTDRERFAEIVRAAGIQPED